MSSTAEPVGTVQVALGHAERLLQTRPDLAAEQAGEILRVAPRHPVATLILAVATRLCGDAARSLTLLQDLVTQQPSWGVAHLELSNTRSLLGQGEAALSSLRRAVSLNPDLSAGWLALADSLGAIGDEAGASAARARLLKASTKNPRLIGAAAALCENDLPRAESLLRPYLKEFPTDIAAIRMLAEIAARLGRYRDAENLLSRCLELAPDFQAARHNYALVLFRQARAADALPQVEQLLATEPHNPGYRGLKAAVLTGIGEYPAAIAIYDQILSEYPHQAKLWMSYGHALKTAGRLQEGITAYRRAITLSPELGEAYWSLANLKTFRFEPEDLQRMQAQLARTDLTAEDRYHFEFALGKAHEDARHYTESFAHYLEGNKQRRALLHYDAVETHQHVVRSRRVFTPELFAKHAGNGCPARDPIFIVGLPRAGSTLIEQILASHSQVEGTMELPDLAAIARTLSPAAVGSSQAQYPECLSDLSAAELRELGERYLQRTRVQRKTGVPLFIDKMPNNFAHVGLIHLILPNARIIDARRHPLGSCLSAFKQHFARGQSFTYELQELGAYYRDYVSLMAHFDHVLPGRVHRVSYESLVQDTDHEIRRLLDYCSLDFEPACLRFYENPRAVRTASSEQVRQPINRLGMDQWQHYERWLGPLKDALGAVLERYPDVPDLADLSDLPSCINNGETIR